MNDLPEPRDELTADSLVTESAESLGGGPGMHKRPKPGERRIQILETLAYLLEQPGADRITTAALAARLDVSEAALYRHFASKAQMYEGLIEFIESSLFTLVDQIVERQSDGLQQAREIITVLLQFGEKNRGMARVMAGDALVFEHERLLVRMDQFFERIESSLQQAFKRHADATGATMPTLQAGAQASVVTAFLMGRLQRYVRSGFKRSPTDQLEMALQILTQ
jgi:TetR/AcrR family transcriptional regulator